MILEIREFERDMSRFCELSKLLSVYSLWRGGWEPSDAYKQLCLEEKDLAEKLGLISWKR